jgi:hypothetical protein
MLLCSSFCEEVFYRGAYEPSDATTTTLLGVRSPTAPDRAGQRPPVGLRQALAAEAGGTLQAQDISPPTFLFEQLVQGASAAPSAPHPCRSHRDAHSDRAPLGT